MVTAYECTPEIADIEFSNAMEQYELNTGRKHKDNSRLLYHMRQSFKPGEVDPQTANRIGYELALEYTGGKHAFVVATHTNTSHIHNHIIFNAFNLDCDGKFRDSYFNYRDIARISDRICKEYDLSVIEVKHGWRDPYNEWEEKQGITKESKEPTKQKQLENIIALCLEKQPKDFDHLLNMLKEEYSCVAKKRGKNISITAPFSKKPMRLNSLSEEFTEVGIRKQIEEQQKQQNISKEDDFVVENSDSQNTDNIAHPGDNETFTATRKATTENIKGTDASMSKTTFEIQNPYPKPKELRLIIDIQNSLKATESIGYKKWAEKFNLEQMSQTLLFIEKHQLSLTELQTMAIQKPKTLANIKTEITAVDEKLQQISLLQRHIGTYGKTKEVYKQYKQSKSKEQFRLENEKAITNHEAARAYFDERGYGFGSGNKLPSIKELREQYAKHTATKKSLWSQYHEIRNSGKEIDNAWANVRTLLNLKDDAIIEQSEKKAPTRNTTSL